jgi:acetoin utilization deacetylase AcuC-like enzyme
MLVLYADDYLLHVPKYEYYDGKKTPHAEQPDRIARILSACKAMQLPVREISTNAPIQAVKNLHDVHYINYLRDKCASIRNEGQIMPSSYIRDTYTPLTRHTYEAALKSAELAILAARSVHQGEESTVYALCRPPGHHAEPDAMMGYCYFNNASLAADELSQHGKVAILDVDYHHGNGTQSIFYDRSDVLYVSLHADPASAFPYNTGFVDEKGTGKGQGYNVNIPLPQDTNPEGYIKNLKKASTIINKFQPDYLVLSLGFDGYESDPIGGLGLRLQDFTAIGSAIAKDLDYPTVIVQEGGYNVSKLESLATHFLEGYGK